LKLAKICYMQDLINRWKGRAKKYYQKNRRFLLSLKAHHTEGLDRRAKKTHRRTFESIDCTQCGNCCRTLEPEFKKQDILRISEYLGLSQTEFIRRYLRMGQEKDYTVQSLPCPFLGDDNLCTIYEVRPKSCRDYPFTDKKQFAKRAEQHAENTLTCPAVFHIVEKLRMSLEVMEGG